MLTGWYFFPGVRTDLRCSRERRANATWWKTGNGEAATETQPAEVAADWRVFRSCAERADITREVQSVCTGWMRRAGYEDIARTGWSQLGASGVWSASWYHDGD